MGGREQKILTDMDHLVSLQHGTSPSPTKGHANARAALSRSAENSAALLGSIAAVSPGLDRVSSLDSPHHVAISANKQKLSELQERLLESSAAERASLKGQVRRVKKQIKDSVASFKQAFSSSRKGTDPVIYHHNYREALAERRDEQLDALEERGHERLAAAVRARSDRERHNTARRELAREKTVPWHEQGSVMRSMFEKRARRGMMECQGFIDWASEVGLTPKHLSPTQIMPIFHRVATSVVRGHTGVILAEHTLGTVNYDQFMMVAKQCIEAIENQERLERVMAYRQRAHDHTRNVHEVFHAKAKQDISTLQKMMIERDEAVCARMKLAAEEEQRKFQHDVSWTSMIDSPTSFPTVTPLFPDSAILGSRSLSPLPSSRGHYLNQLGLPPLHDAAAWSEIEIQPAPKGAS